MEPSSLSLVTEKNANVVAFQVSAANPRGEAFGLVARATSDKLNPPATTISVECLSSKEEFETPEVENVTRTCAGFTVRSNGPVITEIPFEPDLLQQGLSEAGVELFKLEQIASAEALIKPVSSYLDPKNKRTVTTTGDAVVTYMNGIVRHADAAARPGMNFSTSLLNQFKTADPIGSQPMVRSPKAGSNGDLVLDYPIDLRGLRDDFKPSVSIGYSSSAGYSNMGEGWSLSLPQISVETKWGVPAFDGGKETETYLFNGDQLVQEIGADQTNFKLADQPHRTEGLADRVPGPVSFRLRRSDGLWQFKRYGDSPDNYYWVGAQELPSGGQTRFYYFGRVPNAQSYLPTDIPENKPALTVGIEARAYANGRQPIVRWTLKREIDAAGNIIDYEWSRDCRRIGGAAGSAISDSDCTSGAGNVAANDLYLRRMIYYTHQKEETLVDTCRRTPAACVEPRELWLKQALKHEVIFSWSDPGAFIHSDARAGGLVAGGRVLRQITSRLLRNAGATIDRPVWVCSDPIATQTFRYRSEMVASKSTGRLLLENATLTARQTPLFDLAALTAESCKEPGILSDAQLAGQPSTRFDYGTSEPAWRSSHLVANQVPGPAKGGIASAVKALLGSPSSGPFAPNLLGSTEIAQSGGSFYGGIGFMGPSKTGSFGVKIGYQQRTNYREITSLVDISGDGIPDRVIVDGPAQFHVEKGKVGSDGNLAFEPAITPNGMPSALQNEPVQTTRNSTFEGHLPAGIYLASGSVQSAAMQDTYLSDVDGDRRIDVVSGGAVFYNRSTANKISFITNPADSFFGPKIGNVASQPAPLPMAANAVYDDLMSDDIPLKSKDNPRVQVSRRWQAPFDGDVIVDASVKLLDPIESAPKADGVIVSVQRRQAGKVDFCDLTTLVPSSLGETTRAPYSCSNIDPTISQQISDYLAKTYPERRFLQISVKAGDELYFAVHPNFNAEQDAVAWDPSVSYVNLIENQWSSDGLPTAKPIFGYALTQPGEPGMDAIWSSLAGLGSADPRQCMTLDVRDPSDVKKLLQVSEEELGLCDPSHESYLRYVPSNDANAFVDAPGALVSPLRGVVNFLGKLKKPATLYPMALDVSIVHPAAFTNSNDLQQDLLKACRSRVEPDIIFHLPAGEGVYPLSSQDVHDQPLFVYEGSVICAQLRTAVPVEWGRDPQVLKSWVDDLSNFTWTEPFALEFENKYVEYHEAPDGAVPDIFVRAGEEIGPAVDCVLIAGSVERCPDTTKTSAYIAGKIGSPTGTPPAVGPLKLVAIHRKDGEPVESAPLAPSVIQSNGRVVTNVAGTIATDPRAAVREHLRVLDIKLPDSSQACSIPGGNPNDREYRAAIPFQTRAAVDGVNPVTSPIANLLSAIVLKEEPDVNGGMTAVRKALPFARFQIMRPLPNEPYTFEVRSILDPAGLFPQAGERQVDDAASGAGPTLGENYLQQIVAQADTAGTDVVTRFAESLNSYHSVAAGTVGLRFCAPLGARITVETAAEAPEQSTDAANEKARIRFSKLWKQDECAPANAGGAENACRVTAGAIILASNVTAPTEHNGSVYLPRHSSFDQHSPRGASWLSVQGEPDDEKFGEKAVKFGDINNLEKLVRLPANIDAAKFDTAKTSVCAAIGGNCDDVSSRNQVRNGQGGEASIAPNVGALPLQSVLIASIPTIPSDCPTAAFKDSPRTGNVCGKGPDKDIWARGPVLSASRIGLKDLTNKRCELVQNLLGGDVNSCDPGYRGSALKALTASPVGMRALPRASKTDTQTFAAGGAGIGGSTSRSTTTASAELIDLNADGYPDQISGRNVMLTGPLGNYRSAPGDAWQGVGGIDPGALTAGQTKSRESIGNTSQFNISFSTVKSQPKVEASSVGLIGGNSSGLPARYGETTIEPDFSFSPPGLSFGANASIRAFEYMDMNGDGLPDRVGAHKPGSTKPCTLQQFPTSGNLEIEGGCVLSVELNSGYHLSAPREWPSSQGGVPIDQSRSIGLGLQAGFGGRDNSLDYAGGIGANLDASSGRRTLADVNGDGLPDLVSVDGTTLEAQLNNGHGFTEPLNIGSLSTSLVGVGASEADSSWMGAYFTYPIWIPFTTLFIILNPGVQQSNSLSRQTVVFRDLNGDGLPDIARGGGVASDKKLNFDNQDAMIFYNGLGTRNYLQKVYQVTNSTAIANLEFRFGGVGLSNDDPSNHFVFKQMVERDGISADDFNVSDNSRRTCFDYANGRFDRYERRFLGFQVVHTREGCRDDGAGNLAWDRDTERTYANASLYETGLILREKITAPNQGERLTTNRYILIDVANSAKSTNERGGHVVCFELPGSNYPGLPQLDAMPGARLRIAKPPCARFQVAGTRPDLTEFDASARSLQPFLLASEKTFREDENGGPALTSALVYRPDYLGRVIVACDYGDIDKSDDDTCSNLDYATNVRVTVKSVGGASPESSIVASGLVTTATIEVPKAQGLVGIRKESLVRAVAASYRSDTGKLVKTCQFLHPETVGFAYLDDSSGNENPCDDDISFPLNVDTMLRSSPIEKGIAETYYRYDDSGNLSETLSALTGANDYAHKYYSYDANLNRAQAAENTAYCRVSDTGLLRSASRLSETIRTLAIAGQSGPMKLTAYQRDAFQGTIKLVDGANNLVSFYSGECLTGSAFAPNIAIGADPGPEMGTFVASQYGMDYRHTRMTLNVDLNRNITLTGWDGFGRVQMFEGSWASSKDGKLKWEDYGYGAPGAPGDLPTEAPNLGVMASVEYRTQGTASFAGPIARITRNVVDGLYSQVRPGPHGERTFATDFLFDQTVSQIQTVADSDACSLLQNGRPTTICGTRFYAIASGLQRRDRLGRPVLSEYPIGIGARSNIDGVVLLDDVSRPSLKTEYDAFDRPVRVLNPDGNKYELAYRVVAAGGAGGFHATYARNANCVPSRIVRDLRGNVVAVSDFWHQASGGSDLLEKVQLGSSNDPNDPKARSPWIAKVNGSAQQTATCTQSLSDVVASLDQPANAAIYSATASYQYDALNQLVLINQSQRCNFANEGGSVSRCTPGSKPAAPTAIRLGFDAFGRRIWSDDPDRGFSLTGYDLLSNATCVLSRPYQNTSSVQTEKLLPLCNRPLEDKTKDDDTIRLVKRAYLFNLETSVHYQPPTAPDILTQYGGPADDLTKGSRGRVSAVQDGAGTERYTYDALGQANRIEKEYLTTGGRARRLTTTFSRDEWGTLALKTLDGTFDALSGSATITPKLAISYSYNPGGQIKAVWNGPGETSPRQLPVLFDAGFDERGNNVFSAFGNGVTTVQRFDTASNRLTALQSVMGQSCAPLGSACIDPAPPLVFQNVDYSYDPAGNIVHYANDPFDFGSGASPITPGKWGLMVDRSEASLSYDEKDRLARSETTSTLAYRSSFSLNQTLEGDINGARRLALPIAEQFSYTSLGEIARWKRTIGGTASTRELANASYRYPANATSHAPSSVDLRSDTNLTRTSTYDDLGRLSVQRCAYCSRQEYTWNADDTLATVRTALDPKDSDFSEDYNRSEMRYSRTGDRSINREYFVPKNKSRSLKSETLYADENLTVIYQANGKPSAMWHYFSGDYRLASQWMGQSGLFTYHPVMANRNTSDIVYGDRNRSYLTRIYQQFGIAAYGETLTSRTAKSSVPVVNPSGLSAGPQWRFNGKELDVDTGLTYFGARYMDPRLGIWISPDPAFAMYLDGEHSAGVFNHANLASYAFGWNNPASVSDKRGEFAWIVVGAVVGAGTEYLTQRMENKGINGKAIFVAALVGGLSGGLGEGIAALRWGFAATTFLNAGAGAATNGIQQFMLDSIKKPEEDPTADLAKSMVDGAKYSVLASGLGAIVGMVAKGGPEALIDSMRSLGLPQTVTRDQYLLAQTLQGPYFKPFAGSLVAAQTFENTVSNILPNVLGYKTQAEQDGLGK